MHWLEGIPADPGSKNSLPGLQGRTAIENPGICTGPAILGWKGQSAKAWPTMPFGEMCPWVEVGNDAFYRWHGPRGNNTQAWWRPHKPPCQKGSLLPHWGSWPIHQLRSWTSLLLHRRQIRTRRQLQPMNSLAGWKYIPLILWPQLGKSPQV